MRSDCVFFVEGGFVGGVFLFGNKKNGKLMGVFFYFA